MSLFQGLCFPSRRSELKFVAIEASKCLGMAERLSKPLGPGVTPGSLRGPRGAPGRGVGVVGVTPGFGAPLLGWPTHLVAL